MKDQTHAFWQRPMTLTSWAIAKDYLMNWFIQALGCLYIRMYSCSFEDSVKYLKSLYLFINFFCFYYMAHEFTHTHMTPVPCQQHRRMSLAGWPTTWDKYLYDLVLNEVRWFGTLMRGSNYASNLTWRITTGYSSLSLLHYPAFFSLHFGLFSFKHEMFSFLYFIISIK